MTDITREEALKASLETTLKALISLRKQLYWFDAHQLQGKLEDTEHLIRPLLSVLRTPEERSAQQQRDRQT